MKTWRSLSLRVKLTVLYVGLLVLILLALGVTLYLDNQRFLLHSLATRVRAQAKPVIERHLFSPPLAPPLLGGDKPASPPLDIKRVAPLLARDLTSRDTGALVLDAEGKVLARGKRLPEEPEPPPPLAAYYRRALQGHKEVQYTTWFQGSHLLVVLIPLETAPGSGRIVGVVQLSCPLSQIDRILFRQRLVLMVGIGVAALVGTLLGLLITGSTLKGLPRMVATCQAISQGDLSRRVGLSRRGDEIGRLSRAFDQMAERIQASFRAQKRLLANAAHELRTPLTALRGSLEVLLRGVQDDPAAAARLIQGMYRDSQRLSQLCERLLEISRLDAAANLDKRPLALAEFFTELLPQLRLLSRGQEVVLERGPETEILADRDLLTQVILNLFDNAAKYTPPRGEIRLGWREVPAGVELWVADQGPGIPSGELPRLFEPFVRGKTRAGEGAGLGLALVKAIVSAHGGRVSVQRPSDGGCIFSVILPLRGPAGQS